MAQWIEYAPTTDREGYREATPEPGDLVYIRRYQDLNQPRKFGGRSLECSTCPWTGNMRPYPERLRGWLGTTNNVHAEADGAAVVLDYSHGGGFGDTVNPPQVKVRRIKDTDPRIPAHLRD